MVVEDKDTSLAKTQDQIHEGSYELSKKSEKPILGRLHRSIVNQLTSMEINEYVYGLLDKGAQEEFPGKGLCFPD